MKYRPEIDGLRAIAVLPVVFFHAGIGPFHGGFAGVDIFFVISGYLITTLIIGDLDSGKFSILNFYERRARRILPALFLVLAVSCFAAFRLQYPLELNEFSQSVVATVFFSSNIFFWIKSDYFSTLAELKPLLHTWSLAVEEQYYLVFPLLMILIWKGDRRHIRATTVFGIMALLSLVACLALSGAWSSVTFYLLPFRAWELLIGAICAVFLKRQKIVSSNPAAILGALLIVIAVLFSSEDDWPSWQALLPTLGTGLIILFATGDKGIGRVLATSPLVAIGLVSYSLYLWHQPLFAFARLRSPDELSMSLKLGLITLAILLAFLTWFFVEKPFRVRAGDAAGFHISAKKLAVLTGAAASVFVVAGLLGDATDGWPDRTAPSGLTFAQINRDLVGARVDTAPCDTDLAFRPVPSAPSPDCVFPKDTSARPLQALLLGDSHATIITHAITTSLTSAGYQTAVATFGGCIPFPGYRTMARDCNSANREMYRHVAESDYDLIVLAFRPQPVLFEDFTIFLTDRTAISPNQPINVPKMIRLGLEQLINTGAKVVVFEPVPEMPMDIGHLARNRFAFDANYDALEFSVPFSTYLNRVEPILNVLNEIYTPNVFVVKTSEILCDGVDNACPGIASGVALYVDDNHLSRFGINKLMAGVEAELQVFLNAN
jgi:peptidoglycan/LPS O-acetylase OafA/YrhL